MILLAEISDSQLPPGVDCGPLCVHEILHFYEIQSEYQELRAELLAPEETTGASVGEIIEALQKRQIATRLMRVSDWEDTVDTAPSIVLARLSTGETHFVITFRNERGIPSVWDPATRDIVAIQHYSRKAVPVCRISTDSPGETGREVLFYALTGGEVVFLFLVYLYVRLYVRKKILVRSTRINKGGQDVSSISGHVC